MKTAAVIPAYNEEDTIREVIQKTLDYVDQVIVVDDGSTDNTAKEAIKTDATVLIIPENTGKAGAVKRGFKEAEGSDIVVMLDADLQHLPEEIPLLIDCIKEGSDICIGSRFLCDTRIMPRASRFSNWMARHLMKIISGKKIMDPQSGFRAISRKCLTELELPADRYAIEHIMILEAARKRFNIKEVPISCIYGREKSHVRPIRDTLQVIKCILGFMLRSKR